MLSGAHVLERRQQTYGHVILRLIQQTTVDAAELALSELRHRSHRYPTIRITVRCPLWTGLLADQTPAEAVVVDCH